MQISIEYNRISHSHDYRRIKSDVQCNAVLQDLLTVTITVPFVLSMNTEGKVTLYSTFYSDTIYNSQLTFFIFYIYTFSERVQSIH